VVQLLHGPEGVGRGGAQGQVLGLELLAGEVGEFGDAVRLLTLGVALADELQVGLECGEATERLRGRRIGDTVAEVRHELHELGECRVQVHVSRVGWPLSGRRNDGQGDDNLVEHLETLDFVS